VRKKREKREKREKEKEIESKQPLPGVPTCVAQMWVGCGQ